MSGGAMANFATILPALIQGHSVRRDEWDPFIRIFVLNDHLMCQRGNTNPWYHSLTWGEVTALDWQLIAAGAGDEQGYITSVAIPHGQERGFQYLFNESGPRPRSVLFESFVKWWNSK